MDGLWQSLSEAADARPELSIVVGPDSEAGSHTPERSAEDRPEEEEDMGGVGYAQRESAGGPWSEARPLRADSSPGSLSAGEGREGGMPATTVVELASDATSDDMDGVVAGSGDSEEGRPT